MELKKVSINILHPLSISQKIDVSISNNDIDKNIKGFHLELNNKVKKSFECYCYFETSNTLFYTTDKKLLNKKKSFAIEFNYHQIKFTIEEFQNQNIYIFLDNVDEDFELESSINFTRFKTESDNQKFEIDKLELENLDQTEEFSKIFGFEKKYHFDQYRYYVLLYLMNESNQNLIVTIIKNAKSERDILLISGEELFFQEVYDNLRQEDIGDKFLDYKTVILEKLKPFGISKSTIITNRSSLLEESEFKIKKKINFQKSNNIFERQEIEDIKFQDNVLKDYKEIFELETKQNLKNINGTNFKCTITQRKGFYFKPNFSIIILGDYISDETFQNIVKTKLSMEILLFNEQEIVEDIFKKYDLLFSVKNISPFLKIGKTLNLSLFQKIIILSQFIKNTNNSFFIIHNNSILPNNYIEKCLKNKNEEKMCCATKCDLFQPQTGMIIPYEINKNYVTMSECLFPMFHLNAFLKFNFTSPLFGQINRLKDVRNFMIKNNNLIGVEYIKTTNGFSIYEI